MRRLAGWGEKMTNRWGILAGGARLKVASVLICRADSLQLFTIPLSYSRVPMAQGKQRKWPCQGKQREFGNFAKTQGTFVAQVVNSLILKVKDTALFAAKISIFPPEVG